MANGNPGNDRIDFTPAVLDGGVILLAGALPALTDANGASIIGSAGWPVIDGQGQRVNGLELSSNNNQVRGLGLRNFGYQASQQWSAIYVRSGTTGNLVDGNTLTDNQSLGILSQGGNGTVITNNFVVRSGYEGIALIQGTPGCLSPAIVGANTVLQAGTEGIKVTLTPCVKVHDNRVNGATFFGIALAGTSTTGVLVTRNTISQGNPSLVEGAGAIGVFGGAHDNRISFNTVTDQGSGGIYVGDTGTTGNFVEGNVFALIRQSTLPSRGWGIYVYSGGHDTRVYQNTVFATGGHAILVDPGVQRVRVANNLVASAGGAGLLLNPDAGAVVGTNLVFATSQGCVGACGTLVQGEPLFVDAGGFDFRAASCSSAAVEAGASLGAEQPDLTIPTDGVNFWGAAPDLGALESLCDSTADGGADSGPPDAGSDGGADAGDASTPDAGDAGQLDSGAADAGDGGRPDGGSPPPGVYEVGCGCGSASAATLLALLLALGPLSRRRSPPRPGR